MIVAIDGPAGVGKSTVSAMIAKEFGFRYINSGNFYRAVTYAVLKENLSPGDCKQVITLLPIPKLTVSGLEFLYEGEIINRYLRRDDIDRHVAVISSYPVIREYVNQLIKKQAENSNVVCEGRDMSTVVFPDADIKIYLDASSDVRARRREKQGTSGLDYKALKKALEKRDETDRNKAVGRLELKEGSQYIDTSGLTIEQVCEKVFTIIKTAKCS